MKNISSHTAPDNKFYPEYISINQHEKGVSIQARAPEKVSSGGQISCGDLVEIIMSLEEYADFLLEQAEWLATYVPPNKDQLDLGL